MKSPSTLDQSRALLRSLSLDLAQLSRRGKATARLSIPPPRRAEYVTALDVVMNAELENRILLAGVQRKIHELELGLQGRSPEASELGRLGAAVLGEYDDDGS